MVRASLLVYTIQHSDMELIHKMSRISMYVCIHGIKLPKKYVTISLHVCAIWV